MKMTRAEAIEAAINCANESDGITVWLSGNGSEHKLALATNSLAWAAIAALLPKEAITDAPRPRSDGTDGSWAGD